MLSYRVQQSLMPKGVEHNILPAAGVRGVGVCSNL